VERYQVDWDEVFAVLRALVFAHIAFAASRESYEVGRRSLVFVIRARVAQRYDIPVANAV
jgi:outer membrane protein TolC